MLIPPREAQRFFTLYPSLIGFASSRTGAVPDIEDAKTFFDAPMEAKVDARDALFDNLETLDEFLEENPSELSDSDLAHVAQWKRFVRGQFIVERDLKAHTIFLGPEDWTVAYAVLAITTEIVDLLSVPPPASVSAVLLPWNGRILCDGLIQTDHLLFGTGYRTSIRDGYRQAKSKGIIQSFDPDYRPVPTTPKPRVTSPKIQRFLKKCPHTVREFKARFGEPRMDMGNTAALEYATWNLDGTPALDIDYLMIYANVLRHQVLYVYAKAGKIKFVSVVDPTKWKKKDLIPPPGHRLI